MAKRGLIVTYYFPPTGGGGVQRWAKYIKYLSGLGWQFTVVTSPPESQNPRDESLLDDIPQTTEIIYTPAISGSSKKSVLQSLRKSGYWQRWLSAFLNITDSRKKWNTLARPVIDEKLSERRFDGVIFSVPPYSISFLAAEYSQKLSCPVYLDFRDPWTGNPYKIYPTPVHRYLDLRREKKTVLAVNRIISAYESLLEDYRIRFPGFKDKPTLFLPNGYDEDDFNDLGAPDILTGEGIQIGFSGSIYSHLNTPEMLFRAIRRLKEQGIPVYFNHIGTSVYDLKKWAKKYDIENQVNVWGYKPHKECLAMLKKMDLLGLILDPDHPRAENTIGGKFYEYLRLRRPILALVPDDGDAAKFIRKTNSGVVVSVMDENIIARAIQKLVSDNKKFTWDLTELFQRERQARHLKSFLEA